MITLSGKRTFRTGGILQSYDCLDSNKIISQQRMSKLQQLILTRYFLDFEKALHGEVFGPWIIRLSSFPEKGHRSTCKVVSL